MSALPPDIAQTSIAVNEIVRVIVTPDVDRVIAVVETDRLLVIEDSDDAPGSVIDEDPQ